MAECDHVIACVLVCIEIFGRKKANSHHQHKVQVFNRVHKIFVSSLGIPTGRWELGIDTQIDTR